ncbi:diacylglycerol kinase family enzyme [Motilibacter peucedani]|uniref:Diacylglycerol kinase family enzyme n=1 Tax=Motilibacter peucedani TaxID=598650 RepID=A0A420XMT3_9ACTN|nr:diacylglycerol kinase family protein [Motilibacter peucedani]RKS72594.1 diacylglycerol kinase family enzyme [Motilibacter peucedani]
MRALLVANPVATTTTQATRDAVVGVLSRGLEVEVAWTRARGHAVELAAGAGARGFELVVGLGGDGTVNELVNGLLGSGSSPAAGGPALGVVPGGSTNVFARALGLPRDPLEAAAALVRAAAAGHRRVVGLGRADGRWFTFAAGVGLDAEVVRRVEGRRAQGAAATPVLYLREAAAALAVGAGRVPVMQVSVEGADPFPARMAVVANTRPWTYLGPRPVDPFPRASFESGLDVFAVHRIGPVTVTRAAAGMLRATSPRGRQMVNLHDVSRVEVSAERAFPLELDGEALEPRTRLLLEGFRAVLPVVAGPQPAQRRRRLPLRLRA